jgi:uncharacterized protein (DUF2252 family)
MIPPDERPHELTLLRRQKMARSAHAYVRGSTIKFYEWVEKSGFNLPAGPSVWICGDCHVGNLGPLADPKGRVAVQIRDLDQTVIGNPAHDIVRLGLSLASAGRSADLSGIVTAKMLEALMDGYQRAMAAPEHKTADHAHKPRDIQKLLNRSIRRHWEHLARERLADIKPIIPLGRKFWPPTQEELQAVRALIRSDAARDVLTRLTTRENGEQIDLVDLAYWIKGCSSLGRLRYAALVGFGKHHKDGYCLVDIKEATKPAAPRDTERSMPGNNAERVVTGARALSPNLGERMFVAEVLGRPVVVRELMPQDLKIEIENVSEKGALKIAGYLGYVVGRGHARQLVPKMKRDWMRLLERNRPKALDAPTWLWSSVVELVGVHESAYLNHCRMIISQAR